MNPALNPDTPPPPPPKPGSHEPSRGGTPQTNPAALPQAVSGAYQTQEGVRGGGNLQQQPQQQPPQTEASLPRPPTVEEGWLPDVVQDKS